MTEHKTTATTASCDGGSHSISGDEETSQDIERVLEPPLAMPNSASVVQNHSPSAGRRRNIWNPDICFAMVMSIALVVLIFCGVGLGRMLGNEGQSSRDEVAAYDKATLNSVQKEMQPDDSVSFLDTRDESPTMTIKPPTSSATQSLSTNIPLNFHTPTKDPTLFPSLLPSQYPSPSPSGGPASHPTKSPTNEPSTQPTYSPTKPFIPGDLALVNTRLGIRMSSGLTARVVARTGSRPTFGNGKQSALKFHSNMDGAGIVPLDNGGYVYVSNSEDDDQKYVFSSSLGFLENVMLYVILFRGPSDFTLTAYY